MHFLVTLFISPEVSIWYSWFFALKRVILSSGPKILVTFWDYFLDAMFIARVKSLELTSQLNEAIGSCECIREFGLLNSTRRCNSIEIRLESS